MDRSTALDRHESAADLAAKITAGTDTHKPEDLAAQWAVEHSIELEDLTREDSIKRGLDHLEEIGAKFKTAAALKAAKALVAA